MKEKKSFWKKFHKFMYKFRFFAYVTVGMIILVILAISAFARIPISDMIDWQWWLMLFGVTLWSSDGMKQVALERKHYEEMEEEEKEKGMEEELKNLARKKINKN